MNSEQVKSATVLVVDDEPSICWAFKKMLEGANHRVIAASSAEEGLQVAARERPDLVMLDVRLPKRDGISALPDFLDATGHVPVIIMTAFGDLETAVNAVKNGASDYLIKPFRLEEAERAVKNGLMASRARSRPSTPSRGKVQDEPRIVGQSPAIQQAFRQIALVAASDLSVLITGETGTGKELVAAAIHRHSRRATFPYFPIAPVALNPELIESELFGHVKGAFTGAAADRAGLFERAEGGTVLLDEIGDLPTGVQVKLLRVLEQGDYSRVGEVTPRKCDVRILAATNCDLQAAVQRGSFREDLYYRLNGLHIHLPPLRKRTEDIGPLAKYFLNRLEYANVESAISDPLLEELQRRDWLGNIRELRNAIEHAAVVARGRPLSIGDFPPPQAGRATIVKEPSALLSQAIEVWTKDKLEDADSIRKGLYGEMLNGIEPTLFQLILEHTQGNRAKSAEILGIHRGTLREKLRTHGMDET